MERIEVTSYEEALESSNNENPEHIDYDNTLEDLDWYHAEDDYPRSSDYSEQKLSEREYWDSFDK